MNRIFASVSIFLAVLFVAGIAFAQGGAGMMAGQGGVIAIAAALAISVAAVGGTTAQGRAASAALEGIARNPQAADKMFLPMILGLALMESLVIFAFIIAFLLAGKV